MKELIKEAKRMQQLAGIISESQLNEIDDNQLIENIKNLTDSEIHAVTKFAGWQNDKALEGLLDIIKKVNPEVDLEKKKMSLERAWENETSEDIQNAAMKGISAASSVKEYFLDNLQMFK